MERIRKFLALSSAERWLLVKGALLLAIVRVTLAFLPYPRARGLVDRVSSPVRPIQADRATVRTIAWAVDLASRFVPGGGHCLSKAITTQIFLARRGFHAEVRFGALKDPMEEFIAHAWLEYEGEVLIGGENLGRYSVLNPRPEGPD